MEHFVLGILTVVALAMVAGMVYVIVAVKKANSEVQDIWYHAEDMRRTIDDELEALGRRTDSAQDDIYREIDSRMDKMYSKLVEKK